jgi:hypothetical protein
MTDENGVPVRYKGGDIVRHKLEDGRAGYCAGTDAADPAAADRRWKRV